MKNINAAICLTSSLTGAARVAVKHVEACFCSNPFVRSFTSFTQTGHTLSIRLRLSVRRKINVSSEPLRNQLTNNSPCNLHTGTSLQKQSMKYWHKGIRLEGLLKGNSSPPVWSLYISTWSTYMHWEDESKHVPPFSQGLCLSTQRNPVEIGEIS